MSNDEVKEGLFKGCEIVCEHNRNGEIIRYIKFDEALARVREKCFLQEDVLKLLDSMEHDTRRELVKIVIQEVRLRLFNVSVSGAKGDDEKKIVSKTDASQDSETERERRARVSE